MNNKSQKILIIGPSWLGDMVMAQSLFIALKNQYPDAMIDVFAPAYLESLVVKMPEINEFIASPLQHGKLDFKKRRQIGKILQAKNYARAIVLPNSWKSALVPFFAKISTRTGWSGELRFWLLNDRRKLNKKKYPLMVERFLALAFRKNAQLPQQYQLPKLAKTKKTPRSLHVNDKSKKILAICPGAKYGKSKQWPAKYFAEVAKAKIQEGWKILLLGSQDDNSVANVIDNLTGNNCINVVGKTSLTDAIELLSSAKVVLTNDSGLMHVACALDKKVVAIYGSSTPEFTPPLSKKAKIITLNLKCSPCFKRECPHKHFNCMNKITPEMVSKEI